MYGIINNAIAELVVEGFGEPVWRAIVDRAGVGASGYDLTRNYDDSETLRLVVAASDELGLPVAAVMETFGRWWVGYSERIYGALLQLTGNDFAECLIKLDELHDRIRMAFPESRPPSFHADVRPGGDIVLHYRSEREGFSPIVTGILHGLAEKMGISLEITLSADPHDGHAIFHIHPTGAGAWPSALPGEA
ncbi:MAG: heme NO-binding domain-containing protein [Armatimonadota bacterium]